MTMDKIQSTDFEHNAPTASGSPTPEAKTKGKRPVWPKVFKIAAWTIMAVVLFVVGVLMGVVSILTPDRLTPLTEKMVTNGLQNVEAKIGRVELTVVKSFPFVTARIDSLILLSTVSRHLTADEREMEGIPTFSDTVLTFNRFEGGLNVLKLLGNRLDMTDVTIDGPSANLVVINDTLTNFDIMPPSEPKVEKPFSWDDVPGITLRNFSIVNPGPIRYYDVESLTDISLNFTEIELSGIKAPYYKLDIGGRIDMPAEFYDAFNIPDLKFGLNGTLMWNRDNPDLVALENFDFLFSFLGGHVNTSIDFSKGLVFKTFDIDLNPLDVTQLLAVLPEDMAEEFGIPADEIKTDAKVKISMGIKQPWSMASAEVPPLTLDFETAPCSFEGFGIKTTGFAPKVNINLNSPLDFDEMLVNATADIKIPRCSLKYEQMELNEFALDGAIVIPDGNIDKSTVTIRELKLVGPATDLTIKGTLTDPTGEMQFDGSVDGNTDFSRFPAKLRNLLPGTLEGTLTAHVGFRGSPSMFNPNDFYKLAMTGDMTLKDLYWLSSDTVNMVQVDRVSFHFGTAESIGHTGVRADSLLRGTLTVDSARIIHSDLDMRLKNLKLGLAAENRSGTGNKKRVHGMGGGLSLDAFNLLKDNDSTIVRLRNVKGYTAIKPYNGDFHTPEFDFNVNIDRLAAGNNETRLIVRNAHADFNARRIAKGRRAKEFTRIADSVHYAHPHLPPDSVAKIALEIHNRHRSPYPRVHPLYESSDSIEILDWGASPLFKRMLTLWTLEGSLTSRRASLFTPYLPLRNRFRNIDIAFNNDSVTVKGLEYKIGHSDFLVNGVVSNMRRALTTQNGRSALKAHFDVVSDTIDVNQLTEAVMAGSAYSANKERLGSLHLNGLEEDEDRLEQQIAQHLQNAPDSVMPLLIPTNLDAEIGLSAYNVLYSDFLLKHLSGKVLVYNGALNLDNLGAYSDVGMLNISALYSGQKVDDLRFGFGLQLKDFHIDRFLRLVPAVDSILPAMRDLSGIISVDIAATADIDRRMNMVLPSLDAAIGINGDSLVLIDPDTFKTVAKWLIFKDKKRNVIDHMDVQLVVRNSQIEVYPFIFDIDRYKLGIQGYNDFDMNFKYHIAVLKSPVPFKFGINISGNPDKFKVRLGGAKFGEKQIREVSIVDTTRINLMNEIKNVFKRGARDARLARLKVATDPLAAKIDLSEDTLTHADSLRYIEQGLLPPPPQPAEPVDKKKTKRNKSKVEKSGAGAQAALLATLYVGSRRRRKNVKTNDKKQ